MIVYRFIPSSLQISSVRRIPLDYVGNFCYTAVDPIVDYLETPLLRLMWLEEIGGNYPRNEELIGILNT